MTDRATIDFETRSPVDLKKCGAWVYAEDDRTEAMCLSYLLPWMSEPALWHMAHEQHLIAESDPPEDLFRFIRSGGLVEAHNAFFERAIWENIMMPRYGWPKISSPQWRCSAAKAAAWSLPRDLDGATRAAGLAFEKDMAGHRLMLKMCKPRKPRKAEVIALTAQGLDPNTVLLWHEEEEDIYRLWEYCKNDALAEHALSDTVPDLSEEELAVWQADQALNLRGILFDVDLAKAALKMATEEKKRLNNELYQMTGIRAASKRAQVREWLHEHENLELPDTKSDTLKYYMSQVPMTGRALRIIEIVMQVNKTSTSKYQAGLNRVCKDGRIRDLLMYHGAGTGRWSGKGLQIQNFPSRDLIIKDMDEAVEDVKSGDLEWCHAMYGNVMKLLSDVLRGLLIAPERQDLIVADYASIEARKVLWLANATKALDIFRTGGDIYCDMASGIYGYNVTKKNKSERQFGKQAILGLGYGMGFVTFLLTCRNYGIHFPVEDVLRIMGAEKLAYYQDWVANYLCFNGAKDKSQMVNARKIIKRLKDVREDPKQILHELALMKYAVDIYRNRYPEIPQLWKEQERAAIRAVVEKQQIESGKTMWFTEGNVLYCELPSKRLLTYQSPKVNMKKTSWGESKPTLSYMSVNGITRKWEKTFTYGGKIVENITQAAARDSMANALLLAEESGIYHPVLTVHDELGCEVDSDKGSIEDFERLMSYVPPWAADCPIAAEAERYRRYRK